MKTTGEGKPGEDGRGRVGDEHPPTTQATGAQGASGGADEWMGGLRTATPPLPQRGMAADNDSTGTPTRHNYGTDGARPENGALAHRKYGLLAPEDPASNSAAVETQGIGDSPEGTL